MPNKEVECLDNAIEVDNMMNRYVSPVLPERNSRRQSGPTRKSNEVMILK
jgi:hypothetical protein